MLSLWSIIIPKFTWYQSHNRLTPYSTKLSPLFFSMASNLQFAFSPPNTTLNSLLKLDGGNYTSWVTQIHPILRTYDLMGIIDGLETCPPKMTTDDNGKEIPNPEYRTLPGTRRINTFFVLLLSLFLKRYWLLYIALTHLIRRGQLSPQSLPQNPNPEFQTSKSNFKAYHKDPSLAQTSYRLQNTLPINLMLQVIPYLMKNWSPRSLMDWTPTLPTLSQPIPSILELMT